MLDGSQLSSIGSTSSQDGMEHLGLTKHTTDESLDRLTNTNAAILQTQDDISSDSDCSSNSGSDRREQSIYDLPLVVRALRSTLKYHHKQHKQPNAMHYNDTSSDEDEEGLYMDSTSTASLDETHRTPTTSTLFSGDKDLCMTNESGDYTTMPAMHPEQHDDLVTATTAFHTLASHVQLPAKVDTATPNLLPVEEQENQDATVKLAMHYFFENRFMKAKHLLEQYAASDPLHSLGLSSMLFLKAVMINDERIHGECLDALLRTYGLITSQLEATVKEKSSFFGHSVFQYVQNYYYYLKCGNHHLASHPNRRRTSQRPLPGQQQQQEETTPFVANGILRGHVLKAECCLQMAILYLFQGSYSGYIKCGLNMRRAYSSYYFVWQEYQKMGQFYAGHIDKDTLSGLQFGIGAVHLILDSLPLEIKRIVSSFGWKPEKQLGMALIQLSKQGDRIRSPWASLILLAYYNIMTSYCPQILMAEYTQPAIEILLEAQQSYPHSAFFLYFAGLTSRIGRNIALSTQSFLYAIEISKSDWAELDIFHLGSHEIGFNAMMQLDWEEAIKVFDILYEQGYWSRGVYRYLHGICLAMLGLETDAILDFAQVHELIRDSSLTTSSSNRDLVDLERYVLQKVRFFESAGYQDCKLTLGALEYVCLMDGVCYMGANALETYLAMIEETLEHVVDMERLEYTIRENEMDPDTPVPGYVNQRAVLLWMRACIFNVMGRYEDAIPHLNWVIDNIDDIVIDQWVIPFTYWEAGVTAWNMDDRTRGRELWEKAARYKNYSFEGRMSWKLHLAMAKADAQGVPSTRCINKYHGLSDYNHITLSYY